MQYIIYVTAYVSIYTLVLMAGDRFLAVVCPVSSITIRFEHKIFMETEKTMKTELDSITCVFFPPSSSSHVLVPFFYPHPLFNTY